MPTNKTRLRALLATGATLAIALTGASTATANWDSATGEIHGTGSLTLTHNGQQVDCPTVTLAGWVWQTFAFPLDVNIITGDCDGGLQDLEIETIVNGDPYGEAPIVHWVSGFGAGPFGTFYADNPGATFNNAAAGQPSTIVFDDTQIGESYTTSLPITATGTITLNDGNGGNVTLEQ